MPAWSAVQLIKTVFFLALYDIINDMKHLRNCLHHTSAVPQPFWLLIAANLALAGCLGWKWSLWSVPAWLEVQRSKYVFFLILYDSINDMKHFQNCLHHTSAVPHPFLLLIAANLAQAGFLGWKWSLWSVPAWLAVQRSKAVFPPWHYMLLSIILNASELSVLHLSRATAMFVGGCCQFGPSCIFGL